MKWSSIILSVFAVQLVMADAAFVDFDLGLVFPQQLGGMACETVENYIDEGMGYTVFYKRDDHFRAEISVYNFGRTTIETGHNVDGIGMLLQGVESELQRKKKDGLIGKVQKRGSLVVPKKSAIQFANTVFQYSELREVNGIEKQITCIQSIYLTAAHNNFVKVQFYFDVAQNKSARASAEQMIQQVVTMLKGDLSEDQLILAACDAVFYNPADYSGKSAAQRVGKKTMSMGELCIYDAFFVWPDGYGAPENSDLLKLAYFAGMLKVVIPQKLASGGECEAFVAMVKTYEVMRKRNQITAIAQLDEWAKVDDKKALYQKLLIEFGYVAP